MQQSRRNADQGRKREHEPVGLPSDNRGAGEDAVARRAYQRFEARGYEHGRDMEDWLEAERELRRGEQAGRTAGSDEAA
jgi:hypothetical protein